ncbi:unnamed protein product [Clonostachys solani]|uniref:Uncharacterized protein n=1 Tax=Clonostachys solani TaxID=160281 RepID=A0A9N9Z4F1_9HYPO|nr:unnamed protein product [Clonostachys solani]
MGTCRSTISQTTTTPAHLLLLRILLLCSLCAATKTTSARAATITAAPIFLPHYDRESWSMVRGSIMGINETASETTYTIFCPSSETETRPACGLALDFPFIIVGGPDTIMFHGTVTSMLTANLECDLDDTTAATCSGYTSFKPNYYSNRYSSGVTETSWTSTVSGTAVQWGTLTMAAVPTSKKEPLDVSLTVSAGFGSSPGDSNYATSPSKKGHGATLRVDLRLSALAGLSILLVAGYLW